MIEDSRSAYGRLAALVYDIDKPVGRSFGDVEFYAERLEAGQALDVLEPAVGNGRVLVPLAKAGFRMTGFDNSPSMLDYAHRNCADHAVDATILEASLEEFDLGQRFDAVILPAGSFQLVDDVAGAARFLRRCHSHLRRGGHLMVDLDPATAFLDPEPSVRHWTERRQRDHADRNNPPLRRCRAAGRLWPPLRAFARRISGFGAIRDSSLTLVAARTADTDPGGERLWRCRREWRIPMAARPARWREHHPVGHRCMNRPCRLNPSSRTTMSSDRRHDP